MKSEKTKNSGNKKGGTNGKRTAAEDRMPPFFPIFPATALLFPVLVPQADGGVRRRRRRP
jgi:hypothetical protein